MKRKIILHSVYLTLTACFPLLYIASRAGVSVLPSVGAMGLCALVAFCLSAYVKVRRVLVGLIALIVLPVGCYAVFVAQGMSVVLALCATLTHAVGVVIALRHVFGEMDTDVFNVKLFASGVVLWMVFYIAALLGKYDQLNQTMGVLGCIYLALSMILANRRSVAMNASSQARRMMRGNQAMVCIFVLVLLCTIFFGQLQTVVANALHFLANAFFSMLAGNASPSTEMSTDMAAQAPMDLSALGPTTPMPDWIRIVLDILLYAIAIAGTLALLAFLIWASIKAVRTLANWLKGWLGGLMPDASNTDYVEESEQMLTAEAMRAQLVQKVRDGLRDAFAPKVAWHKLTPRQKTRKLYRGLLLQQNKIKQTLVCSSPSELCDAAQVQEFAPLYNKARYSEENVTELEVEPFAKRLPKG